MGAKLMGADLKGAKLMGAKLIGADLTGAKLKGAKLKGAKLMDAYLTNADLTGADLTGADLTGANLMNINLTGAILTDTTLPPVFKRMRELMNNIQVFDVYSGGDVTATEFFDENKNSYFIKDTSGKYTGISMDWPTPSSNGNEYIECIDSAPEDWQGQQDYIAHIKSHARRFIKIPILGVPTMVLKPDWYDFTDLSHLSETNFFNLKDTVDPVKKFMTSVLASQVFPEDFSPIGIDHCNQLFPTPVYKLEPISVDDLTPPMMIAVGKMKRYKTRKMNKMKKTKMKKTTKKTNKMVLKI